MKKDYLKKIEKILQVIKGYDSEDIALIYKRLNEKSETYVIKYWLKLIERI